MEQIKDITEITFVSNIIRSGFNITVLQGGLWPA
jgi:hypothetical protein